MKASNTTWADFGAGAGPDRVACEALEIAAEGSFGAAAGGAEGFATGRVDALGSETTSGGGSGTDAAATGAAEEGATGGIGSDATSGGVGRGVVGAINAERRGLPPQLRVLPAGESAAGEAAEVLWAVGGSGDGGGASGARSGVIPSRGCLRGAV